MISRERDLIKQLAEALERSPWRQAPYASSVMLHPNIIEECKNIEEQNQKRRKIIEVAKSYLANE